MLTRAILYTSAVYTAIYVCTVLKEIVTSNKKRDKEQNHDVPTLRKAMERKHTHHNSARPPCVTGLVVLCSCFEMGVSGHL